MVEKHFVFLKDNRVEQIAVFESQDEELADAVAHTHGFDDALWIGEDPIPARWSTYDPTTGEFTLPTPQYLYSIDILPNDPDAPAIEPPVESV